MNSTLAIWILVYALRSGDIVVYNMFDTPVQCEVQASIIRNIVDGPVECVGFTMEEEKPAPQPEKGFRT